MTATITLLTDFGPGSVYVGEMHATIRTLAPEVGIIDLAHDCPAGDVETAAHLLARAWRRCPPASVHVVVVDPGVGTARAVLAAEVEGHRFVGPDNGVLAGVLGTARLHRVEGRDLLPGHVGATFHGRDVMAPVAARLATGTPLEAVGPRTMARMPRHGPERNGRRLTGRVLWVDTFGNLVTNVAATDLLGLEAESRRLRVRAGSTLVEGLVRTFGDVPPGAVLAYVGSGGQLEIAVHAGRADERVGVGPGGAVIVEAPAP